MKKSSTGVLLTLFALSGCADMNDSQKTTAQGAGIGAAAGALLGLVTAGGNKGGSAATGAIAGAAVGGLGGYLWNDHLEKQKQQMQKATEGSDVTVSQTADNRLKINVPSDAGFATGRAQLNLKLEPALASLAGTLQQNPTETVQIVGYTDSTGSDAINNPLSQDRAQSVQSYLVARGVQAQRIVTQGMGSQNPIAGNDTAEGRSLNRRVEIFVAYPTRN